MLRSVLCEPDVKGIKLLYYELHRVILLQLIPLLLFVLLDQLRRSARHACGAVVEAFRGIDSGIEFFATLAKVLNASIDE